MSEKYVDYMVEEIKTKMSGWRIEHPIHDKEKENYGFLLKKGRKTRAVWIMMDPEGNGMGHLDIEA